ncbi:MAG: site-specific integrase [Clostridia bacterium]|nr:site-specific integrase [Clostridia bacterium]
MARVKKLSEGISIDEKGYSFRVKKRMPDGKDKNRTGSGFKTEKEAVRARKKAKEELEQEYERIKEGKDEIKRLTVDELYNNYMELYNGKYSYGTIRQYKLSIKMFNEYMEKINKKYIDELTTGDISDYFQMLHNEGKHTLHNIRGKKSKLNTIFKYAKQKDYIEINIISESVLPQESKDTRISKKKEKDEDDDSLGVIYTKKEFDEICEVLKDTDYLQIVMIGYYMGLRVGETCGLEWNAFDIENHTLDITQQLQFEDSLNALKFPKSEAGYRKLLYVPDPLYTYLLELKEKQKRDKKEKGAAYKTENVRVRIDGQDTVKKADNFICRRANGNVLRAGCNDSIVKILNKHGIKGFTTHSLRRTHCSILARQGITPQALKTRMGHEKIETTMKYYVRETEDDKDVMKEALKKL